MHRSLRVLASIVAVVSCAAGCGGRVVFDAPGDEPGEPDAGPNDAGPIDPGPPTPPPPPPPPPPEQICPGYPITGEGSTWLESPPAATVQRPLRCMDEGVDTLTGRYINMLMEEEYPSSMMGSVVWETDRVFDYPLNNPSSSHPAAYYVITEMALGHQNAFSQAWYPAIGVYTGTYFVFNSYYTGTEVVLGRDGLDGQHLDIDIAAHEYGHHAIMSLAPELFLSTLHEGMADFLSCVFTGEPYVMSSMPEGFGRPCANSRSWPKDAQDYKEVCEEQVAAFKSSGWDKLYPQEYGPVAEWCKEMQPPYPIEGHGTGMIVSGALWSITQKIGAPMFMPVYLRGLSLWPGKGDFGSLRAALLAADEAIYGGAFAKVIEDEFKARGMTEDVGLEKLEAGSGFACLLTPELAAQGRLPAGPVLVAPRKRVMTSTH